MRAIKAKYFVLTVGMTMGMALFNPILYVFLLAQHYSHSQIGVYLSLFYILSFLTEVPCGIVTDVIGVKKTLMLSYALRAIGLSLLLFANYFPLLLVSALFSAVAESFESGTLSSWIVNALDEMGQKDQLAQLFSRASVVSSFVSLGIGFLSSKLLYHYYQPLPLILSVSLFALLCLFVIVGFSHVEEIGSLDLQTIRQESIQTLKHAIQDITQIQEYKFLFVLLLLPAFIDVGPSNQWQEIFYVPELAFLQGYAWVLIALAGMLGSHLAGKMTSNQNNQRLLAVLIVLMASLVIAMRWIELPIVNFTVFCVYIVLFTMISLRISVTLHQDVVSNNDSRTTVVSIYYALESFVMSAAIFINGMLSDYLPILTVWLMFAMIAIVLIVVSMGKIKR